MGLGVYVSCELKRLRRGGELKVFSTGGEAKASLNRAVVTGIEPEAEAI